MMKQITMTKPHSPHEVKFTSASDPHFVNVEIVKRATGEMKGQHYILKSDVQVFIDMYRRDGFEILTNNEDNGK